MKPYKPQKDTMHEYLSHLAEVNDIQPVFALKDIRSDQGAVLVKKDSPIDLACVKLLREHKLDVPIENSITLEGCFTADIIYALLFNFITEEPSYNELFQKRNTSESLKACVDAFSHYDILRQKLNVLAIQLPDIFDQAFFCGWMVVTILESEKKSQADLDSAFIAAISHDFGLLDVSTNIMFKPGKLNSEEWRAMQQHPAFGAKLLRGLLDIDDQCVRAVLEHHEVMDGSGYPNGKISLQLSPLGQLLYLIDGVNAIYRKHFKSRNRTLHDMIPIIQMSNLSQRGEHNDALMALFYSTTATEHCTISADLIPAAINVVKNNAKQINKFVLFTGQFTATVGTKHGELLLLGLQNIARMIRATLYSCGLINDAYMRWLDQVSDEKLEFAYRELEDALLMTEEIKFHVQRYRRQLSLYLAQPEPGSMHEYVKQLQSKLDAIPQDEKTDSELADYLKGKTPD